MKLMVNNAVNVGRFSKLLFCNMKLRGSTASQQNNNSHVSVTSIELYKDQYFLLNFIMSTYLGPDVFSDNPRCSVAQRLAEGLSPYSSKNLGVSFVSLAQLESLYYYVLKNAHPSLVMNPSMLYMYLKGELPLPGSGLPEKYPQFTSYFPMNIHAQKRYSGHYEIVKGIVLIDDPVTSYMKNEDLERFKRLSGMDHLKVDKVASLLYQHGRGQGKDEIVEKQSVKRCDAADCYRLNGSKTSMAVADGGKRLSGDDNTSSKIQDTYKRTRHHDPPPVPTFSNVVNASSSRSKDGDAHKTNTLDGPAVMQLLPVPNMDTFMSSASITLNGTATKGIVGPPIGVVDIGVSEPAYFFRVALPGIRRDYCEFSSTKWFLLNDFSVEHYPFIVCLLMRLHVPLI